MDPVGLAMGAFGAVCELYRISVAAYALYIDVKNYALNFKKLRLALKIERTRLNMWAQCMGIHSTSGMHHRIRDDSDLVEMIREILTSMNEAFRNSAKMLEDYSVECDDDEKSEPKQRISPGASAKRSVHSYGRLIRWGAFDKKKLEHLVQDLNNFNDKLHKLFTPAEEASLRRPLRTNVVVSARSKDLESMQEAATLVGHSDIEREAGSKAFAKELYLHEDIDTNLGATYSQDARLPDSAVPESVDRQLEV